METRKQAKTNTQSFDFSNANIIKETFENENFIQFVTKIVRSAVREELKEVKEAIVKLTDQVERNESKILTLEIENDAKQGKIEKLEKCLEKQNDAIVRLQNKSNESEQYSRRNCLRLFGVEEHVGENTDDVVMRIAKDNLGINLNKCDIDRSHRTGPPAREQITTNPRHASRSASQRNPTPGTAPSSTSSISSPQSSKASPSSRARTAHHRPIIIKFATYRARDTVIKARRRLKNSGITIVEDLTKTNYAILQKARSSSKVTSAWSHDGRIIVALPTANGVGIKKAITSMEEANKL